MSDYEDYLDAIIEARKRNVLCEVCDKYIKIYECQSCENSKNGYCVLFRVQAEKDALKVGMHKPINKSAL